MKTKKLLSLLLALMMMLSVVPMYASATEALKAANVTQWPTVSYKNADGKMYFGQTEPEALIINDDEIVLDANGNQVAGHFTFKDTNKMPTSSGTKKLNLTFVPDNTEEYTGFNKMFSSVTYDVEAVTPVYVDEVNDPLVASEVEAGAALSTAILSGGTMTNPYNAEEPKILAREWEWYSKINEPTTTIINESGYYRAAFIPVGYEPTYEWVLVRVKGDTSEVKMATEITEAPIIEGTVAVGDKTADIKLTGGKAVDMTGEEVSGVFSFENTGTVKKAGSVRFTVVFTPDDNRYTTSSSRTDYVTVEKGTIKFVDENGAEIVPEVTVDYGTKMSDVATKLKGCTLNTTENCWFQFADGVEETDLVQTGTYNVVVRSYETNSNYLETTLPIKVVVAPKTLNPKIKKTTEGYYVQDSSGTYKPQGTFDVYVDGELYKSGVKYLERVAYVPETSGTHEIKFVYNPIENDNFIIENEMTNTHAINLVHTITASDNILDGYGDFAYGTKVEITANIASENFAGWKVTDANGNEVTLDGVDNSSLKITITMPDYDIHVEAIEKNASGGTSGGIFDMDIGDLSEGDSDCALINIIRNIIAKFKTFLQELIETFRSIGG